MMQLRVKRDAAFDGGAHRRPFRHGRLPIHRRGGDFFHGKFRAAILADQPHRVGAALLAVVHHAGGAAFVGASGLQGPQLFGAWFWLAGEAKISPVFRPGNQRHDVMQERALGGDRPVNFAQVLVVDRCSSLTPGINTELTFTKIPRSTSIAKPCCC